MAEKTKKSKNQTASSDNKISNSKSSNTKASSSQSSDCKITSSSISKIICVIIGVVAVIAIIFAIVIMAKHKAINNDYFMSDDTKLVLTLENNYQDDTTLVPTKSHLVYYYSGETITGVKYYYEFSSNEKATEAFKGLEANDDFSNYALSGSYIIFTFPPSQYENITTEEVRSYLKILEEGGDSIEIVEEAEEK